MLVWCVYLQKIKQVKKIRSKQNNYKSNEFITQHNFTHHLHQLLREIASKILFDKD